MLYHKAVAHARQPVVLTNKANTKCLIELVVNLRGIVCISNKRLVTNKSDDSVML